MGQGKRLADLLKLPHRLVGAEVDGGPDAGGAEVPGLLDRAELDLVVFGGEREQLVVVDLHDEGNPVGVAPRERREYAVGRSHGVTTALDSEADDVLRIEVQRIGSERCGRGVFDALIDRKNGDVAGATESSGIEQVRQVTEHLRRPVAGLEDPIDEVRTWEVQLIGGNTFTLVFEKALGVVAQQADDVGHRCVFLVVIE